MKDLLEFLTKEFALLNNPQEAPWVYAELKDFEPGLVYSRAKDILQRRRQGEPLAYIFGHWAFRSLELAVRPGVLIPRPETEGLVDFVLEYLARLPSKKMRVADLGAGSGALGLSLAEEFRGELEVILVENSAAALEYLRKNVATYNTSRAHNVRVFAGSWNDLATKVDVIVANPPYLGEDELANIDRGVRDYEPHAALVSSHHAFGCYREIFAVAEKLLNPGGALFLEFGPAQSGKWAVEIPERYQWKTYKDLSGKERYLIAFDTPHLQR